MDRKRNDSNDSASVDPVIEALNDSDCRAILRQLSEPMTASELIDACGTSQSTVYRKLGLLSRASLVAERETVNASGGRTTVYDRNVEAVTLRIDEQDRFQLAVTRPATDMNEQFETVWAKMRGES